MYMQLCPRSQHRLNRHPQLQTFLEKAQVPKGLEILHTLNVRGATWHSISYSEDKLKFRRIPGIPKV